MCGGLGDRWWHPARQSWLHCCRPMPIGPRLSTCWGSMGIRSRPGNASMRPSAKESVSMVRPIPTSGRSHTTPTKRKSSGCWRKPRSSASNSALCSTPRLVVVPSPLRPCGWVATLTPTTSIPWRCWCRRPPMNGPRLLVRLSSRSYKDLPMISCVAARSVCPATTPLNQAPTASRPTTFGPARSIAPTAPARCRSRPTGSWRPMAPVCACSPSWARARATKADTAASRSLSAQRSRARAR